MSINNKVSRDSIPNSVLLIVESHEGHRWIQAQAFIQTLSRLGKSVTLLTRVIGKEHTKEYQYLKVFDDNELVNIIDFEGVCIEKQHSKIKCIDNYIKKEKIAYVIFLDFDCYFSSITEFENLKAGSSVVYAFPNQSLSFATDSYCGILGKLRQLKANKTQFINQYLYGYKATNSKVWKEIVGEGKYIKKLFTRDERMDGCLNGRVTYLPDIFEPLTHMSNREDRLKFPVEKFRDFIAKNAEKSVILYLGRGKNHRGYDTLIKLASECPNAVFVHVGEKATVDDFSYDFNHYRNKLLNDGRIWEYSRYVVDQDLVEMLWKSAKVMVSAHRFCGSSGMVLQALFRNKPILVPKRGLLWHWVKKYKIGVGYDPMSPNSLKSEWEKINEQGHDNFEKNIARFKERHSMHLFEQKLGLLLK